MGCGESLEDRQLSIREFIQDHTTEYIDVDKAEEIRQKAEDIMKTGIKMKDAYHLACAIYAGCDCFLTTDDRLLKYSSAEIKMLNPVDFVREMED